MYDHDKSISSDFFLHIVHFVLKLKEMFMIRSMNLSLSDINHYVKSFSYLMKYDDSFYK